MCGIAGLVGRFSPADLDGMLDAMRLRGPDGIGSWRDMGAGVQLGHRRLAIIDLASGDQPMVSADGTRVIVFNGEIFNYRDLRGGLEARGWNFRSASDTEVLLAGLALEGEAFLSRIIGMFALALWNARERTLLLARDRMGIKPLYLAETPNGLAFASELKALLKLPGVDATLDPQALDAYLALRYVPAPLTMVRGVRKFPAAHWARLSPGESPQPVRWWDVQACSGAGAVSPEQERDLDWLLTDATRKCLVSDVPYGVFLSGGVDSGLIAGLTARLSPEPVRTYSIGFAGLIDEREEARAAARAIGTRHQDWELIPEDLRRLPAVARAVDEPFPDPIVLAMDMLAERSGRDVKVILTGEGADELFGGYVHHPHMYLLDRLARWVPGPLLRLGGWAAAHLPVAATDRLFDYPVPPGRKGRDRLAGLARVAGDEVERYFGYVSIFTAEERAGLLSDAVLGKGRGCAIVADLLRQGESSFIDRLWTMEHKTWLVDNILFKQDKTLMAHSVEGRAPFCDHRLVEFAFGLPLSARLGGGHRKAALRAAARRLVPELPAQGRKKAFMIPMDGPYGTEIRSLAGDILTSRRFRDLGLFRGSTIESLLKEFPSPSFLVGKQILSLTMLGLWEREVLGNLPG